MANTKNELAIGAKLYHFGYGALTVEKVEELNGKTYLHTKVDDVSGVPYRFRKNIEARGALVIFDKRTIGHWVFLEEENVLHEDFSFTLEGCCGYLNPYTVDLVHKHYHDIYGPFSIRDGLVIDADGVVISKSR